MYAVETKQLTKKYGNFVALDSLDLKIEQDQIIVLLGPNGSGKTTFLHLISTVLRPTSGTALVMGYDIISQQLHVRKMLGISFQEPRGFWRHKPRHILYFHASVHGIPEPLRSRLVDSALEEFGLSDAKNKRFMDLSGGQAKRLEVAKIFVQKPKIAIFDEPTAMIDLDGKRFIWDKIKELKEMGSTVIVATNEVREAEYLADNMMIFSSGRVLTSGSLEELKDSIRGGDRVDLVVARPLEEKIIQQLKGLQGTYAISEMQGNRLSIAVNKAEDWLPLAISLLNQSGTRVVSVKVSEPALDEIFMKIISKNISRQRF